MISSRVVHPSRAEEAIYRESFITLEHARLQQRTKYLSRNSAHHLLSQIIPRTISSLKEIAVDVATISSIVSNRTRTSRPSQREGDNDREVGSAEFSRSMD